MRLPLAGYYSLHEACAALSNTLYTCKPSDLIRFLQQQSLNAYMTIYSHHEEGVYLSFAAAPVQDPLKYVQITIPSDLLELALEVYMESECNPAYWSNGSFDFHNTHWYPERAYDPNTDTWISLKNNEESFLELSFVNIYFSGMELNALLGLATPSVIANKRTRSSLDEVGPETFIQMIVLLTEVRFNSIPNHIGTEFKNRFLTAKKDNPFRDKIPDNVQSLKKYLIDYRTKAPTSLSKELKNTLRYLAVECYQPFDCHYQTPDMKWLMGFINALPDDQQHRFSHQQWLNALKS